MLPRILIMKFGSLSLVEGNVVDDGDADGDEEENDNDSGDGRKL